MGPKLGGDWCETLLAAVPPTMPTADADGANTSADDADPLMMKAIIVAEEDDQLRLREPQTGFTVLLMSFVHCFVACAFAPIQG